MRVDLSVSLFAWVLLILLVLLFCRFWQSGKRAPAVPKLAKRKREPKPFAGLTRKPEYPAVSRKPGFSPRPQRPTPLHPA